MFTESLAAVSSDPLVELFVARSTGTNEHPLLVIHGGPDWDHTYLRDPLDRLAGHRGLLLPDFWRADALSGYVDHLAAVRFTAEWMRSWKAGILPSPRHHHAAERLASLDLSARM